MRLPEDKADVPRATKTVFDAVVHITDDVCNRHLTPEYAGLARRLTVALARKRPSPLARGTAASWACGVVYALGCVNFLFDSMQKPYLRARDLCALFGVSQSGASAKSRDIMRMMRMFPLHPEWCLESRLRDNPFALMGAVFGVHLNSGAIRRGE